MPGLINITHSASPVVASAAGRGRPSNSLGTSKVGNASEEKPLPVSLLSNKVLRPQAMPLAQELKSSQVPTSARPKQVFDTLAEALRARLYGNPISTEKGASYGSSGSDHEPSSVCLAAMVHEFMENEGSIGNCGRARCNCLNGACNGLVAFGSDSDDSKSSFGGELLEVLEGLVTCASKSERNLLADAARFADAIVKEGSSCKIEGENCTSGCLKRTVMRRLRRAGFNAAICKSRWDHSGGYPAGDYEYIDVLLEAAKGQPDRLIVDVDFRAQFEIARPTSRYSFMVQTLPSIFVGKSERLQQILNVMSNAAKESLKNKGLHLPPWRKAEYMRAKWFSPYKRTTNEEVQVHRKVGNVRSAGIAVRGGGLDARYTSELEMLYHEAGARRKDIAMEVRRLEKAGSRSRSNQITVMSTDWQPPAVNPRKPSRKSERFAGLASVFMQAAGCGVELRSEECWQ